MMISRRAICLLIVSLLAIAGATRRSEAAFAAQIEGDFNATLKRFYRQVNGANDLANRAAGILIFPSIVKAGIGIGGEYGEGALRIKGKTAGYYNSVSASIGFQLGVQARSVIIMFMTEERSAASGAGGSVDTNQITKPVIGFILDKKGLMLI